MKSIKESVKILHLIKSYNKVVDEFARGEYNKKFEDIEYPENTYHGYDGFDVLSETEIRVKFVYGGGDMDFNDSFIVKI